MARQLKLWNGRGATCRNSKDDRWGDPFRAQAYVCAYSREDARRVIEEYCGSKPPVSELRDYWSECWGNAMEGVKPERGLWISFDHYRVAPVRVY